MASTGLRRLFRRVRGTKSKFLTCILCMLLALSFLCHWHSYLFVHGKYSGAYHIYDARDLKSGFWLRRFMVEGSTVSSDAKYGYLLKGYLDVSFNLGDCLALLYGVETIESNYLLVYRCMDVDGYVGGGYAMPLTVTISKLDDEKLLSRVYDNEESIIYERL